MPNHALDKFKLTLEITREQGRTADRAAMYEVSQVVDKLSRLATSHHRYSVHDCNVGLTEAEYAKRDAMEDKAATLAKTFGDGFKIQANTDPRGCPFQLIVPSGRSDCFAGDGLYVPYRSS